MNPTELRRRAVDLYNRGRFAELLADIDEQWEGLGDEPTVETAEICRLRMLSHFAQEQWGHGELWKTRAIRHASQSGWWNGLALIVISQVFRIAAAESSMTDEGHRLCSDALEEMVPLMARALDDPLVGTGFLQSLYHEKKGYLAFAVGDFPSSISAYDEAARHVGDDERRVLKIKGGRALAVYRDDPRGRGRDEALTVTRLVRDVAEGRFDAIAGTARHNVSVIVDGRDDVKPYEIL